MDSEDWDGLTVRTRDGAVLGSVVGVFAEGLLAGRLLVQGGYARGGYRAGPRNGIVVYAIPRSAVLCRRQDSPVLAATPDQAWATWLMHALQAGQARWTLAVVRGPGDEATRARQRPRTDLLDNLQEVRPKALTGTGISVWSCTPREARQNDRYGWIPF